MAKTMLTCKHLEQTHCNYGRCFHFTPSKQRDGEKAPLCCGYCDNKDFCDTICAQYAQGVCEQQWLLGKTNIKSNLAYSAEEVAEVLKIPEILRSDFLGWAKAKGLIRTTKTVRGTTYYGFKVEAVTK